MSAGSGPGSDPHLLALLRAIRLRQNAPDAAEAGAADTAAALSDVPAGTEPAHEPAEPADPGDDVSRFPDTPAPHPSRIPPAASRPPSGRSASGRPAAARPAPPDPQRPADRANPEILWRGDPGATLGRSGLGAKRRPGASKGVWGAAAGRINPITGVNPAGPATPAAPIPGIEGIRPVGPPGTEFPADPTLYGYPSRGGPHGPAPKRNAPGVDGMNPADDAELRDVQRMLSTSLTFAGGTAEVAERLWDALLQAQPDLLATVPGTADTQRRQLARALTWIAHNLDDPPTVVTGCGQLGAALAESGVQWNQLQLVGAALAEALRAGMAPGGWRQDFDQAWRWAWQHTYEWIVHGGTLAAYQPTVWTAEVLAHELRRPDLAVIRVRPFLPMPYRPGQYAGVEVDQLPGVWRPYSLAGAPHRDETLELHVRAKSAAGVSHTLVHGTRTGDRIRLTRAEGDLALPSEAGRGVLMIAGDTGIAPMKAMLAQVAATADPRPVVLFWGVRELSELYDIDDVSAIAHEAPKATVVPVVSEGNPGPYAYGLVTDAVAAYGEWSRHEVCLAGPPLMVAATTAALEDLGVPPARIHHDPPE
ncbi:putative flavohemoprotein [Actinoplanes missouriensis 431]|uniref:Putative flavohemoprotein n=1 Tax=Actinoplanes missouriensis (strain ATCC 14538 / DSM 43046 / CBS 188.64 / JCM 3121 / NBRC 102363 / NCIMB 12654 / NRRL B-3342 / UNCC 431) TaxID=512565 RepID=I0H1L9_ACTM4|nr:flavohemoprotein [Actinoplanes missouriensis]BAL86906.1 putative flavohemoprotein [Actinoplanes missouriensis 431]